MDSHSLLAVDREKVCSRGERELSWGGTVQTVPPRLCNLSSWLHTLHGYQVGLTDSKKKLRKAKKKTIWYNSKTFSATDIGLFLDGPFSHTTNIFRFWILKTVWQLLCSADEQRYRTGASQIGKRASQQFLWAGI